MVRLNLPGKEDYDPNLPWVSKVWMSDGQVAADLFIYLDDARTTGSSGELTGGSCYSEQVQLFGDAGPGKEVKISKPEPRCLVGNCAANLRG